mmetsp:Transcript_22904/g.26049  ORF Transcript_22904/g.26049 Transcript_22904/m.26049 type:complete len:132 (+) Transcript_22904:192-587(+)
MNEGKGSRSIAFHIGDKVVRNATDVSAWMQEQCPSGLPFGVFVDIFSYWERMGSPLRDVGGEDDTLKAMDTRKKLDLTADEAISIQSFKAALPHMMRSKSTSSDVSTTGGCVPGLPTKERPEICKSCFVML